MKTTKGWRELTRFKTIEEARVFTKANKEKYHKLALNRQFGEYHNATEDIESSGDFIIKVLSTYSLKDKWQPIMKVTGGIE